MIEAAKVAAHYTQDDLLPRLQTALQQAGLETGPLTIEQLAPLDQFHSRGLAATIDMGKILNPTPETRILDIGSGLGGPSRYLATTYGCQVTGIDLSPAYVEAATYLAQRTGLQAKVAYTTANALALPYEPAQFDIAWTQHVAMNIADRATFYAEAHRILRPGGRLAIYDVLAGENAPLIYPVPWSRTPETSFLMTPGAMQAALTAQGFRPLFWTDRTRDAIDWFAGLQPATAASLGLHLALGPDFRSMAANLGQNLREGRALIVETIFDRP